jgi:hypothetical protein
VTSDHRVRVQEGVCAERSNASKSNPPQRRSASRTLASTSGQFDGDDDLLLDGALWRRTSDAVTDEEEDE